MRYGTVWLFVLAACSPPSSAERPAPVADPQAAPTAQPAAPPSADNDACAEHKTAFDKGSPRHNAEGLHAAAQCYREAGQVNREIVALQALAHEFPNDPRAKDAWRDAGRAYERIGHTADAARFYEQYARRYPAENDAAELLKRATCFRQGFGDDRAAQQNLDELRKRHGVSGTLAEVCPKPAP